jgi:hypothetical protein
MHWLERFESALRTLIEGNLGRVLGARLQPVDIDRRLAEHMDSTRSIGPDRLYVANRYRVYMAPRTLERFVSMQGLLEQEFCAQLDRHARQRGYVLLGRLHVELLPDPSLPSEHVRIDCRAVGAELEAERTQAIVAAPAAGGAARQLVLAAGGRRFPVPVGRDVTVGRALDNDIILDHPSVSRHHARLIPRATCWVIEDLGSTHGSYVNGRRVRSEFLRGGDTVRLGSLDVELVEPPGPRA